MHIDECNYVVAGKHFERGLLGRTGECVGVFAHVNRTVNVFAAAVFHDCLSDRGNVVLVK